MAAVAKKCYYSNTSEIILFDFYFSDHSTRVAVVSCDGMARAGVYCAAFTSVEQVN